MAPRIEETNSVQEERPTVTLDLGYFPFPVQLNLKPLIDNWRKNTASERFFYNAFAEQIEATLAEHPYLLEPIEDINRLKGLEEFLELLFAPTFPHRGWTSALLAACEPFMIHQAVVATPAFKSLMSEEGVTFELLDASLHREMPNCRTLTGYQAILKRFYDFSIPVDEPILTSFTNQKTGLCRYFKVSGNAQFIEVKNLVPPPHLSKNELRSLLDKPFNLKELERMLPPENFLFSGVMLVTLTPVTVEESLARLQHGLLEKQDTDCGQLGCLELEIRNFFRQSRIRLGLATLQRNGELNFNSPKPLWNSLLLRQFPDASQEWVKDSIYEKALKTGQPLLVEDLEKRSVPLGKAEEAVLDAGYRNILLAPLDYDGRQVGILELASAEPGDLHGLSLIKIAQLKPIFGCALQRHLEEFENKVEAVMLERYTAIHPAIQWRFREATIRLIDQKNGLQEEEIVFEKVFPFYGSLDVRESSAKRNQAILRDLLDNLETAKNALQHGFEALNLSILGELAFQAAQRLQKLQACFCTGDEASVAEFIRKEINPVMEHLGRNYPAVAGSVRVYQSLINAETGIFNRNRLAYEEALALLNRTIATCLDEEEDGLQSAFPCYFEKYQTDGVEYNIYTGAAIAPHRSFDELYLDNIRLRQLLWTCKIIRQVNELQPRFQSLLEGSHCCTNDAACGNNSPKPALQIAPLLLSYGTPITLRFRLDEKRLDVDGSYNVRYEIVKKRIDKAVVLGSQERLTQPGHIAIVYSRQAEAVAYTRHLEYLAAQQYVQPEWEDLELEALQGVDGLRAIRVKVAEVDKR